MAIEPCAVETCDVYPATERLEMVFRIEGGEMLRIVVPLCAEHHRVLEEWKSKALPEGSR